jgi:hypothetical protein
VPTSALPRCVTGSAKSGAHDGHFELAGMLRASLRYATSGHGRAMRM